MTLVRWQPKRHKMMDPFYGFNDFSKELNRLFDLDSSRSSCACNWTPAMDVVEKDTYFVTMDLPGLSKEEVELTLHNNHLSIKGERKIEHDEEKDNVHRNERIRGAFERTLKFPTAVNTENVEASFKNGVLEIRIHKSEEAKARQISIQG